MMLSEGSVCSCAVCVYRPDPQEPWRATRGVFAGDEAEPGRQLAAVFELGGPADRGDESGGRHRPDPWDGL